MVTDIQFQSVHPTDAIHTHPPALQIRYTLTHPSREGTIHTHPPIYRYDSNSSAHIQIRVLLNHPPTLYDTYIPTDRYDTYSHTRPFYTTQWGARLIITYNGLCSLEYPGSIEAVQAGCS